MPANSDDAGRHRHGVPAHVRHDGGLQPLDRARATRRSPRSPRRARHPARTAPACPRRSRAPAAHRASRRPMIRSPPTSRSPAMHAANAPTPGTTSPSASSAASEVAGQLDVGAGPLDRADDGAEVARAVVEDDDRGYCALRAAPLVRGHAGLARVERDGVAEGAGERLELGLDEVVRLAAGQHPHVQREVAVEGERLEDVLGQRAEVGDAGAAELRRTAGPRARRCARSTGARRRRRRPAPAPRRAARWRRRSGGCRSCRRAPGAAPGRARSRCPRRCGGRRCARRRRSARSGRPARAGRTR